MSDAQNERKGSRGRRSGRRQKHDDSNREQFIEQEAHTPEPPVVVSQQRVSEAPPPVIKFVRPADIAPPTDKMEIYCTHHTALTPELEPMNIRPNSEMTTHRHLLVDQFGEARLFCDCLHNGSHEWPPSLQRVETAIELDQFLTDSTSEA